MSHIMGYRSETQGHPPVPETKALQRALAILQSFTDVNPKWNLSALSNELDMRKSTTHRILSALERGGFLSRTPGDPEYRLGPELIVLGARALNAVDLRDATLNELRALTQTTPNTHHTPHAHTA